ncbi:MAG: DUF3093 domain-containing protein [Actinomycetota bacterium]
MPNYRERLHAPASWWLLGLFTAATFAVSAWAGLNTAGVIAAWVVIVGGCVGALLAWGNARIEVTGSTLRAGRAVLPLASIGEVTALDAAQARALRGPRADPAAFMLIRPYLKLAVYVQIADAGAGPPYWFLATRRPAELAAAIETSRTAAPAGGGSVA